MEVRMKNPAGFLSAGFSKIPGTSL